MATSPSMRWWQRLVLVCGGILLALVVGELTLRLLWPTLPSLAPLASLDPRDRGDVQRWTAPPTDPTFCGSSELPLRYPPRVEQHGAPPHQKLWVVGDSVVHGFGVGPTESWPQLLAATLADERGQGVALTRLGGPGLGYCGWVSSLRRQLEGSTPDAVVMQVFADDLELRDLVLVHGQVAAVPRSLWLQSSYLLNRLWLAHVSRLGSARPARDSDAEGLQRFRSTLQDLLSTLADADIPTLLVLVPPAGMSRCTDDQPGFSDCDWLRTDQNLLAGELAELHTPWLDLRTVWTEHPPDLLPQEEALWTTRGRLPVHPGPQGHQTLAEQVRPALTALLPPPPPSAP